VTTGAGEPSDRRRSLSERAYALLLRAYPLSFRQASGLGMAEMFRDLHRDTRRRHGLRGLFRLWLRTILDVARNAPAERIAAGRRGQTAPQEPRLAAPARLSARQKGRSAMDAFARDLRHSARAIAKRPGFALITVLTLALGIGANTAIFSVLNATLLAPLPYPDPDRLAMIWGRSASATQSPMTYPDFLELREGTRYFAGMAVLRGQSVNLTGGETPERVVGTFTTADLFRTVLEQPAFVGRTFEPSETEVGTARPVAVVSHGLWQRRFGGDPGLLGRSLSLNGQAFTVVGILPPDFELVLTGGTWGTEVFLPIAYYPNKDGLTRKDSSLMVVARLARGATRAEADADLSVVAARLANEYPDSNAGRTAQVSPLGDEVVGDVRPALLVLQGAVFLVLLIACANVANLLLARGADRRKEIALRAALGAGRGRIVRQLLAESVLLACAGGLLGTALAVWGARALVALAPGGLPALRAVGLDARVLAFSLGLSLLAGIALGLLPALQAAALDLSTVLKEGGRGSGAARRRFRDLLVVGEVALSLVLLVGAGLLLQSLWRMQAVDPGFRPDHLLTMEFRLPPAKYADPARITAFFREVVAGVRALPGIESAALVRAVPLSGNWGADSFRVEGGPEPARGQEPSAQINLVTPEYFATMGIRLLRGRDFTDHDDASAPPVVVVNETLARQAWPGGEALGKRLRLGAQDRWLSVIGVVADAKHRRLGEPPEPQIYGPHYQEPMIFACVVARTAADPRGMADPVRKAIWAVDKDQPVWRVLPMETFLDRSLAPTRFLLVLLGVFAVVAVLLAGIGIYGVLSYAVAQRTPEIGIRMALGAGRKQVVGLVVGQGMGLTLVASAIGLLAAAGLGHLMRALVFGVTPRDPATLGASALVLGAVALAACLVPALRATRVDPVTAINRE
jgi:putative ABC transport system permease protein